MTTLHDRMRTVYPGLCVEEPKIEGVRREVRQTIEITCLKRSEQIPRLFDYQKDLSSRVRDLFRKRTVGLVALPTGAGKTRTTAFASLDGASEGEVQRIAWLAPTIELLDQAQFTVESLWREFGRAPDLVLCRTVADAIKTQGTTILLATPQKIYARRKGVLGDWDAIIFDEAHQLGARTFRKAVEAMRESSSHSTSIIGLSATPGRLDTKETEDLVDWFGGNLIHSRRLRPNPVRVLQRRGILARLLFQQIPKIATPDRQIANAVAIVELATKLASGGERVLVFIASVELAELVAAAIRTKGVRAASVSSRTPQSLRSQYIEDFGKGTLAVLTNQRLLAMGYDCPAVNHVILGMRIGSPILFEQMVGRAARGPRTGGTAKATIWEFDDHLQLHGLPQSYYRYADFDWE